MVKGGGKRQTKGPVPIDFHFRLALDGASSARATLRPAHE